LTLAAVVVRRVFAVTSVVKALVMAPFVRQVRRLAAART
jgi:hypothetical protein